MEEKKIPIELTEKEAELFIWFRKYQSVWEKARTLKPGSLVLHFNKDNNLGKKEFHYYEAEGNNPLTDLLDKL